MDTSDSTGPTDDGPLARLQKTARVNRRAINRLKERVTLLEQALELVCGDPQMQWLYRHRSERMDAGVPLFPRSRARFHMARYEFASDHVASKTVADIACGTGYGCRILATQGNAAAVTGIDHSSEAIAYATDRHAVPGVSYRVADAADTGLADASLDCLVSFETIEHVPDDESLLDEFFRILKPGGLLICSTPNAWPLEIAPHHVREYERDSFLATLGRRFVVESLYNQNSGSDFQFNHSQPAGIVPTSDANQRLAECFIALARRPVARDRA